MHIKFYPGITVLKFVFSLFLFSSANAQVVYEPANSTVYDFVERLSAKGIVEFNPVIKPVSRIDLYYILLEARDKIELLSKLEIEEIKFYLKDFSLEKSLLLKDEPDISGHFFNDGTGRFRLYSFNDKLLKFNIDPIQGYKLDFSNGKRSSIYSTGINIYGYLSDYLGFSFYFKDNTEAGESIKYLNSFSNRTGVTLNNRDSSSIGYSDFRTTLTASWQWGSFTAGKDVIEWGEGRSGKLVLSQKAPSFPFIKLDIYPVEWLRFNYFHGWLNSSITDSGLSYPTLRGNGTIIRDILKTKFIASHTLSVNAMKGLDISIGESIIYGDKLKPIYLFPLMFFRAADHYESNYNNDAGDNSQFFAQVNARGLLKNTHFFGAVFIDELSITNLFNKSKRKNQSGITIGAAENDLLIENLSLHFEYTRVNPFVYQHYIPTLTYENHSNLLGHWIGSNADVFYMLANFRIKRGLEITGWFEYIRKGEQGTADEQFELPQKEFLSGSIDKYFYTGLEIKYLLIHSLFLRGEWIFSDTNSANGIYEGRKNRFTFSIGYGL